MRWLDRWIAESLLKGMCTNMCVRVCAYCTVLTLLMSPLKTTSSAFNCSTFMASSSWQASASWASCAGDRSLVSEARANDTGQRGGWGNSPPGALPRAPEAVFAPYTLLPTCGHAKGCGCPGHMAPAAPWAPLALVPGLPGKTVARNVWFPKGSHLQLLGGAPLPGTAQTHQLPPWHLRPHTWTIFKSHQGSPGPAEPDLVPAPLQPAPNQPPTSQAACRAPTLRHRS